MRKPNQKHVVDVAVAEVVTVWKPALMAFLKRQHQLNPKLLQSRK
jgi:hypothetical protein